MHWKLFGLNLAAATAGVLDQVAGTGVVAGAGPWGAIGLAAANLVLHAFLASQKPPAAV